MSTLAIPETPGQKPQPPEVPGWMLLTIDSLKLALRPRDVKTIELFDALQVAVDGEVEAGWHEHSGELWPAYCLNRHLALQSDVVTTRRYCVFLEVDDRAMGILCDHVSILSSDEELDVKPVSGCMVLPCSPVKWMASLNGEVVVVVDGHGLGSYLSTMEEEHAKSV